MSFLSQFTSCCPCLSRGKASGTPEDTIQPEIDETSRLIPSRSDEQPTPTRMYVDQQRVRERLVTIVRAKEGKMVNVMSYRHSNASRSSDSPGLRSISIADETVSEESASESNVHGTEVSGVEAGVGESSNGFHAGPSDGSHSVGDLDSSHGGVKDADADGHGNDKDVDGGRASESSAQPVPTLPALVKQFEDTAPKLSFSWGD